MSEIKTYKDLRVWQKSIEIAETVYSITENMDNSEKFGIITQMRRSSVSVASNIAEGWGRELTKSFINFLRISRGSLYELETQAIIAERTGLIKKNDCDLLLDKIQIEGRMLNAYISSLGKKKYVVEEDIEEYENILVNIQSPRTKNQSPKVTNTGDSYNKK